MTKHKQDQEDFQPEFPGQHPGEEVEMVFRQHPIVMRKALIYGMFIMLASEMPLLLSNIIPSIYGLSFKILGLGVFLTLLYWFYTWIGWHYSIYILTDQRLIDIHQKGFFNRQVREVGMDKIQSINYHIKGVQAALFKFGDITVQTYTGDWVLKAIHHPVTVHTKMMEISRLVDGQLPGR